MPGSNHIAVVGGSGSGKTWLARVLCEALGPGAARLSLDDFYRDLSHLDPARREEINFDDPAAIDWEAARDLMDKLSRGVEAGAPEYDFSTHTRLPRPRILTPPSFLVWDGLWLLHDPGMRERFLFSVFVDCDEAERVARRVERDVRERGRGAEAVRRQFQTQVRPMHERFVEPQRALADRVFESPAPPGRLAALKQELIETVRLRAPRPEAMP